MEPSERKRSRGPEEFGSQKQQRLEDSPISDPDLAIHVHVDDDDLLTSPVERGASVEQEFQLKPSPHNLPEAPVSDDSESFPLSKGSKPGGEKRKERRYRGGAETEHHSRDKKGREKSSKRRQYSPAREREHSLKVEGSRKPLSRGSPQYKEGERARREEREKRERVEGGMDLRHRYKDRPAQRRADEGRRERAEQGRGQFDREEWSWERERERDLMEPPRRADIGRELGGRGRREAAREKDLLREDKFSGLLGRRSKSPRRPERSDRLDRLDRPVQPVRESSLRGREREPAERRRGRFLEQPGQQVRERHRFKRERQLRGEGWEERERPTGKTKISGSSDSDTEFKRHSTKEEKIEDLIKEVEELEDEEEEEDEGDEGVGESSSEQSSEEERGGSSGSETDSEGSALEASGGENRERTRRKRKTLAKDAPEAASDPGAETDESDAGDHSPVSPPAQADLKRAHTEPVMRSKFDDDDDEDDDDDSGDQGRPPRPLYKGYSGYEATLGDSDVSGDSGGEPERGSDRKKGPLLKAPLLKTPSGLLKIPKDSNQVVEEPMEEDTDHTPSPPLLPPYLPALMGCRSVENYEWLNRIEEGTYGVVYRAKDRKSGEVVALKKLKMEKEKEGFPITSLREINMLLKARHPNIVHVREIVVGSNMDKIYIVMDYVEHDLKALMETMKEPFLQGEVKTLMLQLLRAVHHLHDNWILHRDLKASNLLLSHKGILKVGDFGLAREYGSPLRNYTPVVVTLWYRSPELLLGTKEYSTAVDMWSVGCIFAEFLLHKPLFRGKSEIDQLNQIFKELGTPSEEIWPGYSELPVAKKVTFTKQPYNNLRKKFPYLTGSGFDMLNRFLTYDPKKRITAEQALEHAFFKESPLPVDPSMFPTWPARSEGVHRPRERSPSAPEGGAFLLNKGGEDEEQGRFRLTQAKHGQAAVGAGFSLKF